MGYEPLMATAFSLVLATCLGIAGGMLPVMGARAGVPEQVGGCVATSITLIGTHSAPFEAAAPVQPGRGKAAVRAPGQAPGPTVGHVVGYANAGSQVSASKLPEIARSLLDDRVQMCLVGSLPACTQGAPGGRTYRVTNERTRETWTLPDTQRRCAGP